MIESTGAPSHWLREVDTATIAPRSSLRARAEVAVVGGGIMGVCTAYWLSRLGVPTVLLEARYLAWGATGRNAGLMLAGTGPLEDPGLVRSVLDEEGIAAYYDKPGHLALATTQDTWKAFSDEASRRRGAECPVYALDRPSCEELLGLRIGEQFLGGRWLPSGGLVHPALLVYGLAAAARRRGACLMTETPVVAVEAVEGGACFEVSTTRGKLRVGQVVFACNTAVGKFVPEYQEVITPVRGQVLATSPLPPVFRLGLGVDFGTVYWRQAPDGAIVLGGYRNRDPITETSDLEKLNPLVQQALDDFLSEAFPGFPAIKVERRWAGIMDYPHDGKPMIGCVPARSGEWLIAGFGGHGLPGGLGAGKALAEAIVTGRVPPILEPFSPDRFKQ